MLNPPNTRLIWDAVLLPDGTVQAEPPLCVLCDGLGKAPEPHVCLACHGSGHGPHLLITPENWIGGLVVYGETWQLVRRVFRPGPLWNHPEIIPEPQLEITGRVSSEPMSACTPLAPPPSAGCTLPQALALLPGAQSGDTSVRIDHGDGLYSFYATLQGARFDFHTGRTNYWPDTAPLRLAIQRHDAIQQYIAGWGAV